MDIEQQIAETVARQAREDTAGRRAAAEPLPGPLRDAFSILPNIEVGPYSVRPFYDIDFEFLAMLEHPLHKMMTANEGDFTPRGPHAWELCWILTRDADTVEGIIQGEGLKGLRAHAKKEFGKLRLPALAELSKAIVQQLTTYWSTVVAYGAASKEGEQSADPTASSVVPLTVSVG